MSLIAADLGSEVVFLGIYFTSVLTGTHARLSTKHTGFEERVYNIPIRINDGGRPPLEGTVSLPGRDFAAGNLGCLLPWVV